MKYLTLIIAILIAIGCAPLPIGYYTFLRFAVFAASIVVIIVERGRGVNISNILFAATAILFNPIFPVYLHRKMAWTIIDAVVAVLFAYQTYYYFKKERQ